MTPPTTTAVRRIGRIALVAAIAVALVLAPLGPLGSTPVAAGDDATIVYFETTEIDASPGETVTLDLEVRSHGGPAGDGIDELSIELAHDPDVLTVTDVEHGPMLAAGDSDATVDGTAEIDDEAGTVTIAQERTPSGDGAKATDVAATLTLEIAADAEATSTDLEIADAEAILVSGYPQPSTGRDVTIHVAGGDGGSDDSGTAAAGEDGDDDPVPGFGPAAALAALVGIAVLVALRAADRPQCQR